MPANIGPYVVDREIGRGGMGVVYLARDPQLDRDVAIKALPDELASDPDRLGRFEREAKALAALNHPGIASIYGVEKVEGKRYLILEYVPGETLDAVVRRGPIPVMDALPVAQQIAEAIEHAHKANLLHRDLKPANIKFAEDNRVKVLDFGLAKVYEDPGASAASLASSPTYVPTNTPTMPGVVLGTAGYLSPEQARGRQVDRGTDIFSFGCVLYEMLAGHQAFEGETVTDSLGATLHREPQWDKLPADTPPTIQLLLRRCLAKDRRRRLQDIGDARIELESAIVDPSSSSLGLAFAALGADATRRPARWRFALAVVGVGALAASATWLLKPEPERRVEHLSLELDSNNVLSEGWPVQLMDLAPNGDALAYVALLSAGEPRLLVRPIGVPESRVLPDTARSVAPCFSPDGKWIAFMAFGDGPDDASLRRISVDGGPALLLCKVDTFVNSLDWGPDDTIAFVTSEGSGEKGGLWRVSGNGGVPERLTLPDGLMDAEATLATPSFLPDGSGLVVTAAVSGDWDRTALFLLRFEDGSASKILDGGADGRVLSTGHLVYRHVNTLMAAGIDLDRGTLTTAPVPVLEGVGMQQTSGRTPLAIDARGTLVYLHGAEQGQASRQLYWVESNGGRKAIAEDTRTWGPHRLAWDFGEGRERIAAAATETSGDQGVYMLDVERNLARRLVSDQLDADRPIWAVHEGVEWIVFQSEPDGVPDSIQRVRADFSGEPEVLLTATASATASGAMELAALDVSRDGRRMLLLRDDSIEIADLDPEGRIDGEPRVLVPGQVSRGIAPARFSPDGVWVLYASDESGQNQIYVRAADGSGSAEQVSVSEANEGRWSPTEPIIYISETRVESIAAVPFTIEDDTFRAGAPVPVAELGFSGYAGPGFEVHPDGRRFSVVTTSSEAEPVHPSVVLNWVEELKRRVPLR